LNLNKAKKVSLLPDRWNRPRKRANTFPTTDDCGPQKRQKCHVSLLYSILVGEEDANSLRLRSRLLPKNVSSMRVYGATASGPDVVSKATAVAKMSVGNPVMPRRTRGGARADTKPTASRSTLFPHSGPTKPLGRLGPLWSFGADHENCHSPITNEGRPAVDDPLFAFHWILTIFWGRLLANCALPAMTTEYSSSWESGIAGTGSDEPLDLSCPMIRQNDKRGTGSTSDSGGSYGTFSETVIRNNEVCRFRRGRAPNRSRDVGLSVHGTTGPPILMKQCSSFESGANSLTNLKHLEEVIHSLSDIMPVSPPSRVSSTGGSQLSTSDTIRQELNLLQPDSAEHSLGNQVTAPNIPSRMAPNSFTLPFISPTFFNNSHLSPRPTFNLYDASGFHKTSGTDSRMQNNLSKDFGGVSSTNAGFEKDSSLFAMFSHLMMVNR
uniref:Protein kinase domain-containing protein n=1 Tax=Schistocephalus solidus TaxID=70667 RepID=A0A183T2V3_SCHSO